MAMNLNTNTNTNPKYASQNCITINELMQNKSKILDIKSRVESRDASMFSHFVIPNCEITPDTITIVMTASNRSKQTYFALKSMLNSKCKDLQIILVDDSATDPIYIEELKKFPFYIDLIVVNKANKNWANPCVNYNIGFQFIQGRYVVVQNAEVCYVGDPLSNIRDKIKDDEYFVFDVIASCDYETNEKIYGEDLNDIFICNKPLFCAWYQHSVHRNKNFHFFTAMTRHTFSKINGFSYDYSIANEFDDDDFVLKIIANNIAIVNIPVDIYMTCGIHLFHGISYHTWGAGLKFNYNVLNLKKHKFDKTGQYIDFIQND